MKQRVEVYIAGQKFALLSERAPEHVNRVAQRVDGEINAILPNFGGSTAQMVVLAALNIADELLSSSHNSEGLRMQIQHLVEENSKLKLDLADARRELSRLKHKE